MKSFFKKLAFVMAFAMVVSMAAPAAQRAAAATAVRICYQNTQIEVTSEAMAVGQAEEVDLCFKGAPSDWGDYTWGWATSDPTVAVVDKNGVVIPVGAGTATITLVTDYDDVTAAPVTVTVTGAAKDVAIGTSKTDTFTGKEIMLGDEEVTDLNFYGVTDWNGGENYRVQWVSSDMKVAKVDKLGRIEPVAPGKTTVTFIGTNMVAHESYVGKVEITVVDPNAVTGYEFTAEQVDMETIELTFAEDFDMSEVTTDDFMFLPVDSEGTSAGVIEAESIAVDGNVVTVTFAKDTLKAGTTLYISVYGSSDSVDIVELKETLSYTAAQVSDITADLTFDGEVAITAADISLSQVGDNDIEVAWPIEEVKVNGNVVTIKPYVAFSDGDKYIVRVGADDEGHEFTTTIGVVDQIVVTYESMGQKDKAFTNGEDGEEIIVRLSAKLYSKGIDVTNVYGTEDVVYTLMTENENIVIDEYAGEMSFYRAGITATVVASYTAYDEEGNELPSIKRPVTMVSESAPEYKVTGVKAWTIVKDGQDKIDWNNLVKDIKAYDDGATGYHIVALITDNYGNTFVTDVGPNNAYVDENAKIYAIPGSKFDTEGYSVEFSSANVEKLLVGIDGSLTTYTAANVPAIISLHNVNSERENNFVRNLSALPVTVKAARTINRVTVDNALTLVTGGAFTTGTATVKVYDQYGDIWGSEVGLSITASIDEVNNSSANPKTVTFEGGKEGKFTLDGAAIKAATNKTSVSFTVKEDSGKTATVRVTLRDPKYNQDGSINVTSWSLVADGIDQKIDKEADGTTKAATVSFFQLSNSNRVGLETDVELVTSADGLKLTTSTTEKLKRYIVVYAPNGSIVDAAASSSALGVVDNGDGSYKVNVASADGDTMKYAATGNYTVKVLEVSSFNRNDEAVFRTKYSANFTVTNTSKDVALKKQTKLESSETDIRSIVKDTIEFTLGGGDWNYKVEDIVTVKGRYNAQAGYVVITSVTFNVPLNGNDNYVGYEKTVSVNKSVKVSGVTNAPDVTVAK